LLGLDYNKSLFKNTQITVYWHWLFISTYKFSCCVC
jgi:hypothetical protein